MNAITQHELSAMEPEDIGTNTTTGPSFEEIVEARLTRRSLFKGGRGAWPAPLFLEPWRWPLVAAVVAMPRRPRSHLLRPPSRPLA